MTIEYFEKEEQFDKISHSKPLAVVSFSASWCPPCRAVGPYFEQYSEEFENAHFYKIQLGDEDEPEKNWIFQKAGISKIPTFVFYKNAVHKETLLSSNPHDLKEAILRHY